MRPLSLEVRLFQPFCNTFSSNPSSWAISNFNCSSGVILLDHQILFLFDFPIGLYSLIRDVFSLVCYKKYALFTGNHSGNTETAPAVGCFSKMQNKKSSPARNCPFIIYIQLLLCVRIDIYVSNIFVLRSCLKSLYA